MALDALVDSAQLNSDLKDVADAIREKSGGTGSLTFPSGFVSEIEGIEKGYSIDDVFKRRISGNIEITEAGGYSSQNFLAGCTGITGITAPFITDFGTNGLYGCTGLVNINFPLANNASTTLCSGCTSLEIVVLPKAYTIWAKCFSNCTKLSVFDNGTESITNNNGFVRTNAFENDPKLKTLIFRWGNVVPLSNINNFTGTPFAEGGTGGTIYIPQNLIEDYKIATNWSTLYGYGTVTFAAIEGSQYENYYADGTAISS